MLENSGISGRVKVYIFPIAMCNLPSLAELLYLLKVLSGCLPSVCKAIWRYTISDLNQSLN